MIWFVAVCTLVGIVLVFRQTWETFDNNIRDSNKETRAFWDAKVVRGFDGKDHLVSIPLHLKVATCLIYALCEAVVILAFARFVWGFN